jgi:hypothetical protein
MLNTADNPASEPALNGGSFTSNYDLGERNTRVSSEWNSRPDDERFLSLSDLQKHCEAAQRESTEVSTTGLRIVDAANDGAKTLGGSSIGVEINGKFTETWKVRRRPFSTRWTPR